MTGPSSSPAVGLRVGLRCSGVMLVDGGSLRADPDEGLDGRHPGRELPLAQPAGAGLPGGYPLRSTFNIYVNLSVRFVFDNGSLAGCRSVR